MNLQQILDMLDDYPNNTHDQEIAVAVQQEDIPFSDEFVTLSRQDIIQLKAEANSYKLLHQRALLKIKTLEEDLDLEKGKVRDLTHRLYGKKTENQQPRLMPFRLRMILSVHLNLSLDGEQGKTVPLC